MSSTGKTVGWEPAEQSGFAKYIAEALAPLEPGGPAFNGPPGTYELIGPKISGNPEGWGFHSLIPHGALTLDPPLTFDGLREALLESPFEGIVWHHPDGRMVKLKRSPSA
jgi:hypothetical protein